jgi:5-oxopent-3-ene-1,2,5-tricarboxylate decarboxylase / 2-hydroxyhepta-2,4-diene-1,7-dioate isomerase
MADAARHPGTIYGVLLNDHATLARLGPALNEPPYKAPPRAPVMYVKTSNTRAGEGAKVAVPAQPGVVCVGGTLGLVMGPGATRLSRTNALAHVRALVIASDLCLPHESVFRPAVRLRCRDGFCPLSAELPPALLSQLASVNITIRLDGVVAHERSLSTLVRDAAALLADVTEFMSLAEGDVLLLGPPEAAPLARADQRVEVQVPGLGTLQHALVAEPTEPATASQGAAA